MLFLVLLNIWIYWAWLSFISFIIGAQHRRNLRERRALWMVSLWSQGWKRQVDFYYQSLNYIINCACFSFVIKNTNTWFVFFSPHLDFPDWEVMFSSVKSLGDDLAFLKTLYTLVCTVAKGGIFVDQSVSCSTFKKNKCFLPFWLHAFLVFWGQLNFLKMHEMAFRELQISNFLGGACPRTPLAGVGPRVETTHSKSWIHPCETWTNDCHFTKC